MKMKISWLYASLITLAAFASGNLANANTLVVGTWDGGQLRSIYL